MTIETYKSVCFIGVQQKAENFDKSVTDVKVLAKD